MPFTPAKCTQCNANLQVDSAKDAAVCEHCGTPFIVEKAINHYNTTVQAQNVIINAPNRDFEIVGGVLKKYHGAAVDVVVPEEVVEIGEGAFQNCIGLRSVVLSGSVERICIIAFRDCTRLQEITLNQGLKMIDGCAFENCTALHEILIPNGVEIIDNAFIGCFEITRVVVDDVKVMEHIWESLCLSVCRNYEYQDSPFDWSNHPQFLRHDGTDIWPEFKAEQFKQLDIKKEECRRQGVCFICGRKLSSRGICKHCKKYLPH
ncbi:MAG: leucine-rich repeat domain-containing protein [Oscillospiraceae bacterium]|nr:leucine-rich repeat domain-containing protein [Oscillospiraceae bacterium]